MGIAAKITPDRRLALGSVFLVANALVWYTLAANILETVIKTTDQQVLLWSVHFASLMISLFLGVVLLKKISQNRLFLIWTTFGIISPLLLFAQGTGGFTIMAITASLFGISLGLGMPSCMAYFTSLTEIKNRGRYGGLIMLLSVLGGVFLSVLGSISLELTIILLIIWRTLGLSVLFLPKAPHQEVGSKKKASFAFVLRQRSFVLYLVPWLMFALVGYLSVPVQKLVLGDNVTSSLMLVETIIVGVFAVISGFLIDYVGRKRIAILAFVLVGIEFSILGLYPEVMASWIIYTVLDGVVWGTLYVLFVMSIWGDLSQNISTAKYYAIGFLPFFTSKYLSLVLATNVANAVSEYALFSFTAFFLFLAVLPLVYAPETLPEKLMKERELKSYIEKAQKMVEKEQGKKEAADEEADNGKEEEPTQENSEEYEKAKQLAEKYY